MDRNEPKMCDCSLQERIFLLVAVQPLEKLSDLALDASSCGRNIVNLVATDWS